MTTKQRHADEVLQRLRRRRPTPACYPCSKRKVRCAGGRPCGTCIARGHAEICHDEQGHGQRPFKSAFIKVAGGVPLSGNYAAQNVSATANPAGQDYGSEQQQQHSSAPGSSTGRAQFTPASAASLEPRVGKFAAMTFIRDRLGGKIDKVQSGELHPTIGLGDANGQLPMLAPLGSVSTTSILPPTREEVLRFYPPFRDCVMPLYPAVSDKMAFESLLHKIMTDSSTQHEHSQTATILAALALGAQFEEMAVKPRVPTSLELINRSNSYLQRANYIFHPTLEAIQALLMIGMVLQNAGRPDGAWNLLGLNYRLAQSLGLHLLDPNDEAGNAGATLWSAIIWQDSLLSCRYDRRPLTDLVSVMELTTVSNLSYHQALRSICALDIGLLGQSQSRRLDVAYVGSLVQSLDDLLARCCEHLQPDPPGKARTFQQRLEQGALKLHSSLLLADICRPMFSINAVHDDEVHRLRRRGFDALKANIEAYLEIWSFSNIPVRQWSMTQATVSCAIVLALLMQDPRSKHPSIIAITTLLRRVANVLKMDIAPQNPEATKHCTVDSLQGVCLMRIKGASLLEAILESHTDNITFGDANGTQQEDLLATPIAPDQAATSTNFESLLASEDLAWPADLPVFDRAFCVDSVWDFPVDPSWYDEHVMSGFD